MFKMSLEISHTPKDHFKDETMRKTKTKQFKVMFTCSWKPPSLSPRLFAWWSPPHSDRAGCQGPARKTSLLYPFALFLFLILQGRRFLFVLFLFLLLEGRRLTLFSLQLLQWALCPPVLCSGCTEAGSFSAIYNIHLGRHPDIPKLFRPPLSRPVPHILCLLLTLQRLCQRIPQPRLSFQVCFAPPSHRQNAFLFLSQHSPPHSRHLPGQAA